MCKQRGKAEHLLSYFSKRADEAMDKIDFYKLKSTAKDKAEMQQGWQNTLDCCTDTIEILEEYLKS